MKQFYFCPKCHCKVIPPKFSNKINIQGGINITCGNKNCSGKVKIKPKKEVNGSEQLYTRS